MTNTEGKTCIVKPYNPKEVRAEIGDIYLVPINTTPSACLLPMVVTAADAAGFRYEIIYGDVGHRGVQKNEEELRGILVKEKNGVTEIYFGQKMLENFEKLKLKHE